MTKFRIAFGKSSCVENKSKDPLVVEVCKEVMAKISHVSALSFEQVEGFSSEEIETKNIKGKKVTFTIYKQESNNGVLIVVQAFFPTLIFPNYIFFHGIGKVFAEGVIFSKEGFKNKAKDSEILNYR